MYTIPGYIKIKRGKSVVSLENLFTGKIIEIDYIYFTELEHIFCHKVGGINSNLETFLYENDFLIDEKWFSKIITQYYAPNNSVLSIILMPTEKCNFRCIYCYENHDCKEEILPEKNQIIQFISDICNRETIKYLSISWFGGEPLLKIDYILKMNKYISEYMNIHFPKIECDYNITTNGYLLNKVTFEQLINAQIRSYQITLDGTDHDKTRILISHKPTLNTIINNLLDMKSTNADFSVNIRININENSHDNENFYFYLSSHFGNDHRFGLSIHPIFNSSFFHGTNNLEECRKMVNINKKQIIQAGLNLIENKDGPITLCYACRKNTYVFRPNGNIEKCTVLLGDKKNIIGSYNQNRIIIDSELNKKTYDYIPKEKCINCDQITACRNHICLKDRFEMKDCDYHENEIK